MLTLVDFVFSAVRTKDMSLLVSISVNRHQNTDET